MTAGLPSSISSREALRGSRSCCAPALLVAYAIGATLWTPSFMLIAAQVEGALARIAPGAMSVDAAWLFTALWLLRFALYAFGAHARWDYGYGINGVIVNRQLVLAEKLRRIAHDWFGVVLIVVWLYFMAATLAAMIF